jgi:hypothetical protein
MHITYRKIVEEPMSPAPPLLSRLMYSAHFQNREVYCLLFDCIALPIPDATYPGMLASLRFGLDCAIPIRASTSAINGMEPLQSGTEQRTSRANGVITYANSSARNRSGDYGEQGVLSCSLAWMTYSRTRVYLFSNRIVQRPVSEARGT